MPYYIPLWISRGRVGYFETFPNYQIRLLHSLTYTSHRTPTESLSTRTTHAPRRRFGWDVNDSRRDPPHTCLDLCVCAHVCSCELKNGSRRHRLQRPVRHLSRHPRTRVGLIIPLSLGTSVEVPGDGLDCTSTPEGKHLYFNRRTTSFDTPTLWKTWDRLPGESTFLQKSQNFQGTERKIYIDGDK